MKPKLITIFYVQQLLLLTAVGLEYEDITSDAFEFGDNSGVIAAFGNFNSDELTDIFCLQSRNKLQVFLGSSEKPYFNPSRINCSYDNFISGVVPGDFNGDSKIDILIVLHKSTEFNELKILWGNNENVDCKSDVGFIISKQPLIMDFNGDMIPDVIAEDKDGNMNVWISSVNKVFDKQDLTQYGGSEKFRKIHSSGLIDLNDDMATDLLLMGERHMEMWFNVGNNYTVNGSRNYPEGLILGQSTFVDFDRNGRLNHIIPMCYDSQCKNSAIRIWDDRKSDWVTLLDKFEFHGVTFGFKLPVGSAFEIEALPITLRAGDVNMDGYPDFIIALQSNSTDVRGVILLNEPCDKCNTFNRQLRVEWEVPGLSNIANIQLLAFYDIFEDGSMDIIASTEVKGEWKMHALKNVDIFDSCFMKVLVLNGLCYNNCSTDQLPYGINQPGPMVRYNMTTQDGCPVVSSAIQLSQSAHFPLQLPYSLFGLGQTPNFIDVLTISIPAKFDKHVHKREWTQIIPNSQMVVIPYPPLNEQKWVKKLFVTPSHLVLLTCISLLGTCFTIILLVGLLHWQERKEDKKEKMQDAHRFHFDAM